MRLLAIVSAFLLTACAAAEEPPAFPYFSEEGGRVRDLANILSSAVEKRITQRLEEAETNLGPQMVVVTVDTLHGYDIADFSLEYARAWGIGDKTRNDGLQLMVAPNERKVRIEVGKGIEQTFTDRYAKEVIDLMLPYFRNGDYDAGVNAGVSELIEQMRRHPTLPANDNSPQWERKAA